MEVNIFTHLALKSKQKSSVRRHLRDFFLMLFLLVTDFSIGLFTVWLQISGVGETIFLSKIVPGHYAS